MFKKIYSAAVLSFFLSTASTALSGDEVEALREKKKMIDGYFLRELIWNKNKKIQSVTGVKVLDEC